MSGSLTPQQLARLLPGSWLILATNMPVWVLNTHLDPRVTWELRSEAPLVLESRIVFETEQGHDKTLFARSRFAGDHFVRRSAGLGWLRPTRWRVDGVSDDGLLCVVRTGRLGRVPDALTVLLREGQVDYDARAVIARDCAGFGLTPEDFASLTWFDPSR